MANQLTAQNATAAQIEHHLEFVVLPQIQYYEGLIQLDPSSPLTSEEQRDLAKWKQTFNYFVGLYKKKGGRDMVVDMPTHYVSVTPPQKLKQKARAEMRRAVDQLSTRCQMGLLEVQGGVRTIYKRRANSGWMVDMLFTQAGGLNVGRLLAYIEMRMIKPAEKALREAQMYQRKGDFSRAYANLVICTRFLSQAGININKYYDSLEIGAPRIQVAIILGASIVTGMIVSGATSGYGGFVLSTADKVKLGVIEGAALSFGGLGIKAIAGEQVSAKDLGKALLDTAKSGGGAWVGGWAKDTIAPRVAALRYGKPTAAQLELVGNVVEGYFKANSSITINAFGQLAQGKEPDYDWLAGLVSPAMGAVDARLGTADKIAHDIYTSEGEIAKEMKKRDQER